MHHEGEGTEKKRGSVRYLEGQHHSCEGGRFLKGPAISFCKSPTA